MTSNRFALRSLQAAATALALVASHVSFAEEPWTLAKDSDGVKVYVRDVPNSRLREFRGEVDLKASPDRVVKVLQDAGAFRRWMPDVVVSDLLKATDGEQFHYLENATPWPVAHRDGVYHFIYTRSDDAVPVTTVRVEAIPDYVPAREGKVRIPKAEGYWKLVPTPGGVGVSYQMHADPGGSIPSWLANQTVVDTPFKTLKALRDYVQAAGQ